jgi:HK97 family phage prohead protease
MTDAPREDLLRSMPFTLRAAATADDDDGDGFTIDGYAAVYDTPTRIDSWEGTFDEQIAYGAFRKSLSERVPRMQFDHGTHPLLGSLPLGRWTDVKEEQDAGLHTIGRLHDNWLVEPFRDAISEGSVDSMSFRFSVVREEWRDAHGKIVKPDDVGRLLWNPDPDRGVLQRTLKEVKISEAGPVVWPAYDATSVGTRSKVTIDLGRLRSDPEQRKNLARAVYMADASTSNTSTTTGTTGTADAPPTDDGGHPTDGPVVPPDAPPASDTPGEHPSASTPNDSRAQLRAEARRLAEYVQAIKKGATRHGG